MKFRTLLIAATLIVPLVASTAQADGFRGGFRRGFSRGGVVFVPRQQFFDPRFVQPRSVIVADPFFGQPVIVRPQPFFGFRDFGRRDFGRRDFGRGRFRRF